MPTIVERGRIPTSLHTQPDPRFLSSHIPMRFISGVLGLVLLVGAFSGCANRASVSTSPQTSGVTVPTTRATPSVSAARPSSSPPLTPSPGLPTGNWTGIHWTAAKTSADVWTRSIGSGPYGTGNVTDSGWAVFGWDKGYAAFDAITTVAKNGSETTVIESEHSTDGLSWSAGQSFSPPSVDRTIGANSGQLHVLQGTGWPARIRPHRRHLLARSDDLSARRLARWCHLAHRDWEHRGQRSRRRANGLHRH